jgi:flagella basal body P-ring formation protein FlgA
MTKFISLLLPLLLLATAAHGAEELETPASLKQLAENFVAQQTAGQPGAEVTVGAVDSRLRLPRCAQPEAFLPAGSRLWGNATVGLRCSVPVPWTVYIPVTVKVMGMAVVSARPLAQGQALSLADLSLQKQDLTQLPAGVITDQNEAIGKTLASSIPAGYPLRADMLRAKMVVFQGQAVKITAKGTGFSVSAEGKAMGNAEDGQPVQVRTPSGQIVKGIARAGGIVEIPF